MLSPPSHMSPPFVTSIKLPPARLRMETSKVPPPRSNTIMVRDSLPLSSSKPKESAAAVGSGSNRKSFILA